MLEKGLVGYSGFICYGQSVTYSIDCNTKIVLIRYGRSSGTIIDNSGRRSITQVLLTVSDGAAAMCKIYTNMGWGGWIPRPLP